MAEEVPVGAGAGAAVGSGPAVPVGAGAGAAVGSGPAVPVGAGAGAAVGSGPAVLNGAGAAGLSVGTGPTVLVGDGSLLQAASKVMANRQMSPVHITRSTCLPVGPTILMALIALPPSTQVAISPTIPIQLDRGCSLVHIHFGSPVRRPRQSESGVSIGLPSCTETYLR